MLSSWKVKCCCCCWLWLRGFLPLSLNCQEKSRKWLLFWVHLAKTEKDKFKTKYTITNEPLASNWMNEWIKRHKTYFLFIIKIWCCFVIRLLKWTRLYLKYFLSSSQITRYTLATFDCIAPTAQIPALSQVDVYEENLSNLKNSGCRSSSRSLKTVCTKMSLNVPDLVCVSTMWFEFLSAYEWEPLEMYKYGCRRHRRRSADQFRGNRGRLCSFCKDFQNTI